MTMISEATLIRRVAREVERGWPGLCDASAVAIPDPQVRSSFLDRAQRLLGERWLGLYSQKWAQKLMELVWITKVIPKLARWVR